MMVGIRDCEVLLARDWGARKSLEAMAIRAIITDIESVDDAVKACVAGEIVDHTELLH